MEPTQVPTDAQALIDQMKVANDVLATKVRDLEARTSFTAEQLQALQAEIQRAVDLGKS